MKNVRKTLAALGLSLLMALPVPAALAEEAPEVLLISQQQRLENSDDGLITYPVLSALSEEMQPAADRINVAIQENAHIQQYMLLLPNLRFGSVGLQMTYEEILGEGFYQGRGYYAVLFSVEGKMLTGLPSQVYYPMVFDVSTGEQVTFDQVFADPEGARAYMEEQVMEQVEDSLSTYLENRDLLPIPYDRFALSGQGQITFYYDHDQLSFLSGQSGAVSFRYSELSDFLDLSPDAPAMNLSWNDGGLHPYWYALGQQGDVKGQFEQIIAQGQLPGLEKVLPAAIGSPVEQLMASLAVTTDSGFYPGGAFLETEDARLRGTLILTDEGEQTITGFLTGRADAYGIETGRTTVDQITQWLGDPAAKLPMDEAAAELYRVCPGTALIYPLAERRCTLYADTENVLQFIKVE
ncbi:MAG: hypothetical protein IJ662_07235 [Clostridia bacterium]|nr:hypothetical protein [Clostridia bacterium]